MVAANKPLIVYLELKSKVNKRRLALKSMTVIIVEVEAITSSIWMTAVTKMIEYGKYSFPE